MSNDLIKRGDVRKLADWFETEDGEVLAVDIDDVDAIPAVPQEMSARELFNTCERICEEYSRKGIIRCDECPLYSICPEIKKTLRVMNIWAYVIETWAQKHPEEANDE